MVCDSEITLEMHKERYAIGQIHEFACEIINCIEHDDETVRFTPLVVEDMYFMMHELQNQPNWVEDWLNWWFEVEVECFGKIPSETTSMLVKQFERRLRFAKYIESM